MISLYMESKTLTVKEIKFVVTRDRGWGEGEMEKTGGKVLTYNYKTEKY